MSAQQHPVAEADDEADADAGRERAVGADCAPRAERRPSTITSGTIGKRELQMQVDA